MFMHTGIHGVGAITLGYVLLSLLLAAPVFAHCDTLDGPVVKDAELALEKGDPTPVLKWVRSEDEAAVRAAFKRTLAVRSQSPQARELSDMYFFETLVRIHRAGEGEPYTGLKPAGTALDPAIEAADKALASSSAEGLVESVRHEVEQGIRHRFERASEKKSHVEDSVEAGREFVAAYVDYVHFVEKLHEDASETHHTHAGSTAEHGHAH